MQTQICDTKSKLGHEIIIETQNHGLKGKRQLYEDSTLGKFNPLSHTESLKSVFLNTAIL